MIPTTPHLLTRIDNTPAEPVMYKAWCGYCSTTKREFTMDVKAVMCEECIEKLGLKSKPSVMEM